jgi:hypothetical protein
MHPYTSLLLLATAGLHSVVAQNISAAPTSPYCQGECRANFTAGWEFDAMNWVVPNTTNDAFYDLPLNLSAAKPGDILKWQGLDAAQTSSNWTIPSGQALSRVQYATEDLDGSIIAASAFILLPYAPRHGHGKISTLAWSHGTSGISPVCAPSNHKNLYYEWSAPFSFAQRGYAVIATDFAGMGSVTPKGFQYCVQWTHAADIAFSVAAARQRLGDVLTDEWVSLGQSEGGAAAWRLNQRLALLGQEALLKAEGYLGWVEDLFRGKAPADGCSRSNIQPITERWQSIALTYQAAL